MYGACLHLFRVPTQTGKPGKMGRHFPVREKSGNFEQTEKVRENHTKYWKTEINWDKYYLIFLVIFKWTVHYLLKCIKFSVKKTKHLKNTGKMAKNTGKVREFCQSGKVGTLLLNCTEILPHLSSSTDSGFLRRMVRIPEGAPTFYFSMFSRKFHEAGKIDLVGAGAGRGCVRRVG